MQLGGLSWSRYHRVPQGLQASRLVPAITSLQQRCPELLGGGHDLAFGWQLNSGRLELPWLPGTILLHIISIIVIILHPVSTHCNLLLQGLTTIVVNIIYQLDHWLVPASSSSPPSSPSSASSSRRSFHYSSHKVRAPPLPSSCGRGSSR